MSKIRPQVALAQSVRALQFSVGYAIVIAPQGGIVFANLQGMAFLAQSNIQLGRYILQHCNFSLDLINFLESDGKWRWMNFFG